VSVHASRSQLRVGIGKFFETVAVPAAAVKVPGGRKGVSVNNLREIRGV
jgi:hypothetical protein